MIIDVIQGRVFLIASVELSEGMSDYILAAMLDLWRDCCCLKLVTFCFNDEVWRV